MHSGCAVASCTACIDACPAGAVTLAGRFILIDGDACTRCGLCQAACPQAAIAAPDTVKISGDTALMVCGRRQADGDSQTIGCVHALGLEQLAGLHAAGTRILSVATGKCDTCSNGAGVWLEQNLADFNFIAQSRGLPQMQIRTAAQTELASREPVNEGRRRLFRSLLSPAGRDSRATGARALAALQAGAEIAKDDCFVAFSPEIDPARCNACDACFRLCPEGALTLLKLEGGTQCYASDIAACTGCGICSDVCDQDSIDVASMVKAKDWLMRLRRFRCAACGTENHELDDEGNCSSLCRICSWSNHHKKLFQVLS